MSRFIAVAGGSGGHIRSKAIDAAPSLPPFVRKRNSQTLRQNATKAGMPFVRGFILRRYPDLAPDV